MTLISNNAYIDKLDAIVDKYNNTYQRTIKLKPYDINSSSYIAFGFEHNDKDPKFKVGVRKFKNRRNNILAQSLDISIQKRLCFEFE